MGKLNYIKIQNFCSLKENRKGSHRVEMFPINLSDSCIMLYLTHNERLQVESTRYIFHLSDCPHSKNVTMHCVGKCG